MLCLLLAGCANPQDSGQWMGKPWMGQYQCRDGSFSSHCPIR